MTWSKTAQCPFNPLAGESTEEGLEAVKAKALEALNGYLKKEMRFSHALEDWDESAEGC